MRPICVWGCYIGKLRDATISRMKSARYWLDIYYTLRIHEPEGLDIRFDMKELCSHSKWKLAKWAPTNIIHQELKCYLYYFQLFVFISCDGLWSFILLLLDIWYKILAKFLWVLQSKFSCRFLYSVSCLGSWWLSVFLLQLLYNWALCFVLPDLSQFRKLVLFSFASCHILLNVTSLEATNMV